MNGSTLYYHYHLLLQIMSYTFGGQQTDLICDIFFFMSLIRQDKMTYICLDIVLFSKLVTSRLLFFDLTSNVGTQAQFERGSGCPKCHEYDKRYKSSTRDNIENLEQTLFNCFSFCFTSKLSSSFLFLILVVCLNMCVFTWSVHIESFTMK